MTTPLGVHYILEFCNCAEEAMLRNVAGIDQIMINAARAGRATVVSHHFHQFEPFGVSGAVILEESHITIHTWPEHGYAAVDVFFCNLQVDYLALRAYLEEKLRPARVLENYVERGVEAHLQVVA